jgi:osmotically-inducible protein OsmY
MSAELAVLDNVRAALKGEVRLDHKLEHVHLVVNDDGSVTVEAEVPSVSVKKLALERIGAVPGVDGIVDRLHVAPASEMGDGEIRAHLRNAFLDDPSFKRFDIRERRHGSFQNVQGGLPQTYGSLDIEVTDGIVTLNGRVPGLESKRLAGLLAWWIPGTRDVVNGIEVDPPEDDSPDHVAEALRIAFDKDPFIDANRIAVRVSGFVVTLTGFVPREIERERAESDAWCLQGVNDVVNEIKVAGRPD